MPDVPSAVPLQLRAGLNASWRRSHASYPAPTWVMRYWLKNSAAHIELVASASSGDHLVALTAANTSTWSAGVYSWTETVEDAGAVNKFQTAHGVLEILPRIDTAVPLDQRTAAGKILEGLLLAYQDFVAGGVGMVRSYTIGDRSQTFHSAQEILDQIDYWSARVKAEQDALALADGHGVDNKLYVRGRLG